MLKKTHDFCGVIITGIKSGYKMERRLQKRVQESSVMLLFVTTGMRVRPLWESYTETQWGKLDRIEKPHMNRHCPVDSV